MAKKTDSTPSQTPPSATQPKARQTLSSLRQDIETFLTKWNGNVFYNERDLQINLAIWLKRNCWDVDVEYFVPREAFDILPPLFPYKYVWDSDMKLDIVVKVEEEFYIIELKYKTKIITSQIDRFGESPIKDYQRKIYLNVPIVKNQGAQNHARYDFWKDVRRIELATTRFNNVKGGLAIFVTNDMTYMRTKQGANYSDFSMEDIGQSHGGKKCWAQGTAPSTTSGRPCFYTIGNYETKWWKMGNINPNNKMYVAPIGSPQYVNPKQIPNNDGLTLCYCIVEIPPCNSSSASAKPGIDDNRSELIHKNKK